ncbi:MAG TPA: VOC family protein [Baekduia sp.]|nr:VOC family protein [Baekduia sp.]
MERPRLLELRIAADPAAWTAAGFAVDACGRCRVARTDVVLLGAGTGTGIAGWTLGGAIPADDGIDGLRTESVHGDDRPPADPAAHANGAVAVDHVVVATPDLARTLEAFDAAGLELRRLRDAGTAERPLRQGFLLLADALVEVVGPPENVDPPSADAARLWGVTFVVDDLDAAAAALGDALGPVRDAVQPGRRIAAFRREAGLGAPVALMTPRR